MSAEPRIVFLQPKLQAAAASVSRLDTPPPDLDSSHDITAAGAATAARQKERTSVQVSTRTSEHVEDGAPPPPKINSSADPEAVAIMDSILSLQHSISFSSKHQQSGIERGGDFVQSSVGEDITPPPIFSRLPPDGHEFPPNYVEPCALEKPKVTDRRSPKWRQDEKSLKSVRDKIALFSSEKQEDVMPEIATSLHPQTSLSRFRSTEDVSIHHNSFSMNGRLLMERAVSTLDLAPQQNPITNFTDVPRSVSGYSTLPRKPSAASSTTSLRTTAPSLGRAMSFSSGVTPNLHARSQSLINVNQASTSSLTALLEQRKRGFSKLRGLVIPERPEALAQAAVDLPEIRSRDIPLLNSKPVSRQPSLEPREVERNTFVNHRSSLLPDLPSMPKYSPAFKRKSLVVYGNQQEEPRISPTIKPIQPKNFDYNFYNTAPKSLEKDVVDNNSHGQTFGFQPSMPPVPKSLDESLSSPHSDFSFEELGQDRTHSAAEDGESDSAVSSGRSSPPDAPRIEDHENNHHTSLRRTLSSETASSTTSSTASSTLTSGSESVGRRMLKPQSVEAVNRKNVLASARHSNGRPSLGSPLIQRRFEEDDNNSGHYNELHSNSREGNEVNYVVHTMINDLQDDMPADREVKIAYVDEICELEFVLDDPRPQSPQAPPVVAPPVVLPRKIAPEQIPPIVAPRKMQTETIGTRQAPPCPSSPETLVRISELHSIKATTAQTVPEMPRSLPPNHYSDSALTSTLMSSPQTPPKPNTSSSLASHHSLPSVPTQESTTPPCSSSPLRLELSTSTPCSDIPSTNFLDVDGEKPKDRWSQLERKYEATTTHSNRSSVSTRQQEKLFKVIAERWQLLAVDAATPRTPQQLKQPPTPRGTAEKKSPGCRSSSVTDIRRAFERAPAMQAQNSVALAPNHMRVSSLDSSASEETSGSGSTNAQASALLSSANSMEQLGSISSLASSTSLISQQELQGLLDEAGQCLEEGVQGEVLVLVLHRDSLASSIGITLAGGADYEAREITVHKVLAGSPAERDARVQKGDRILSINGKSMKNLTHREALTILKAPRPEVVLVISRGRSDSTVDDPTVSASPVAMTPHSQRFSAMAMTQEETSFPEATVTPSDNAAVLVSMSKDGAGLGFSLEGGRDSPLGDRPLTIKKIFTGGAAEKTGKLNAGGQLLAVNGTDVSGMSRIEAWSFMKRLPLGPVTLLMRPRPPGLSDTGTSLQ